MVLEFRFMYQTTGLQNVFCILLSAVWKHIVRHYWGKKHQFEGFIGSTTLVFKRYNNLVCPHIPIMSSIVHLNKVCLLSHENNEYL